MYFICCLFFCCRLCKISHLTKLRKLVYCITKLQQSRRTIHYRMLFTLSYLGDCLKYEITRRCNISNKSYFGCADIDECEVNNGGCHMQAICNNTEGNFTCTCQSGFTGDGFTCRGALIANTEIDKTDNRR